MGSNEYRALVQYARELGLTDEGIDGSGHHQFSNPETGAHHSISTTVQYTGRGPENARAALRRVAGVDNRGRKSVEGERRERRRLGRLSSGFSFTQIKKDRARNVPVRDMGPTREELAAEREALMAELLEMSEQMSEPNGRAHRLAARVKELDEQIDAPNHRRNGT